MALDTSGNQAVDYVWGTFPMQPDAGRTVPLDKALDNHVNAETGWNGYPGNTPGVNTPPTP